MALLHHNESDAGPVVLLELHAGLADGEQLLLQHSVELALAYAVTIHHQPVRLEAGLLIEVDQGVPDHAGQRGYDVPARLLDPNNSAVGARVRVYGADEGGDTRLLVVPGRGVSHLQHQ